ncbi:MAG: hypothetical protein KatS3mg031_2970 [Chitinophagales bacterium]|nr:MAG: hypothetical protein KatS3mg031_2970 [Chitinophagales bacterium]
MYSLKMFSVMLHGPNFIDPIYIGPDEEEARAHFQGYTLESNQYNMSIELSVQVNQYEFIDDDDDPKDWPIEKYCDVYYRLVEEGEWEVVEHRHLQHVNAESDKILSEVQRHFAHKYGNYKYNDITVFDQHDNVIGNIQLRISDHTENILNNDRYVTADYYISVVIADLDETSSRFGIQNAFERRSNEYSLYYNSERDADEIIDEIEGLISRLIDKLHEEAWA